MRTKFSQIAIFLLLASVCALSQTTTTITGTIRDLSNALVTSGKVTFSLQPSRDTTISGYARFSPQTITCAINASGLIKAQDGVSVCTLTMNTALQPTGTYYLVKIWPANVATSTFTFYAVLSTYDWSTVVPTPTTSPAQNFVDIFSNQTIGGNKAFLGTLILPVTFGPFSIDSSGALTDSSVGLSSFVGSLQAASFQGLPTAAALFQGNVCVSSTLCTAILQGGANNLGLGVFNGLDAIVRGGNGLVSGAGGGVQLNVGADFSGATPPGIKTNALFTKYGNINTVANGLASEYAAVDLVGQTAAITTTTLYAVPSTGATEFRVSWNAKVTTAAGTSSTLGALTIVYTDPDGVVQTITAPASIAAGTIATSSTGNTTATVLLGLPLMLNCKALTNITYAMAYASNAANAMNYNLHIRLEAL